MADEKKVDKDDVKELRQQLKKLQARIDELEGESGSKDSNRSEQFRRFSNSKRDVVGRFFRGATLASLEGVRLFTDTASTFTNGVLDRAPKEDESVQDLARRIPGDLVNAAIDAIEGAVDIPGKAAERFSSAFREGKTD